MFRAYGFLVILAAFFLLSCSKLQYLDQALTVKAYSDEQDAIGREVDRRDARFKQFLAGIRSGQVQASVATSAALERQFGEPVLKRSLPEGFEWLYRHQVNPQQPKVYVKIAPDGKVLGFRLEE